MTMKRDPADGPRSVGKSINLSADFYSFAYLHKFKRKVIFDDEYESDQERIKEEETDSKKRWSRRKKGKTRKDLDEPEEDSDEEAVSYFYNSYRDLRYQADGKLIFLVICQLLLLWFLADETLTSEDMIAAFKEFPASMEICLARFLCAVFLHITLCNET